jgi:quercetin dioxygenase-like cupin family protein
MNVMRQNSAPRYQRDHITSYLLVSVTTCQAKNLAVTVVKMEPGGIQHLHAHHLEQMYYILEGSGVMTVDGEQRPVQAGDCIFFASQAAHGLHNNGDNVLRYLSAASPSFTPAECERLWPLASVDDEK